MGLNAVAVKKELIRQLVAAVDDRLTGVQVEYMLPGDVSRELVYGGRIDATVNRAAMDETSDRDERATIALHIRVLQYGAVGSEAEERAAEIGGAIADLVAADPTLGGTLFDLTVVGETYECGPTDDGQSGALGTLQLSAQSYLDA
jgi:hypothetical protein